MSDLPIACTLQPGELSRRTGELLPGLAALAKRRESIEGGYRFEFDATTETLNAIITAIDAERQCCRFLRFQLVVEPAGGPARLDVTGPAGTQAFLTGMLEGP
jgi:hypothetical protein